MIRNAISALQALLLSVGGRWSAAAILPGLPWPSRSGAGAVFWMWVIALVGMATSLIECSRPSFTSVRKGIGTFRGGPARAILHGLGWITAGLRFFTPFA